MALGVETTLRRAGKRAGVPYFERYEVLKSRLFAFDYEHVHAGFPSGTNHGRSHIERVLTKLDQLLGASPYAINDYELFLSMVSILYHDIGILRGRPSHNETSAMLLAEELNEYLVDQNDRAVIEAAVVSHSSSEDIGQRCAQFSETEVIGGHTVRPRVVAALVRLADELDEDYRRADVTLEGRLHIGDDSKFYWRAAQRIRGILPQPATELIRLDVKFSPDDVGDFYVVNGRPRAFVALFADKLAKINRERLETGRYLPQALRYQRLVVSVKPLEGDGRWLSPRDVVFGDETPASAFVAAIPEMLEEPARRWLVEALDCIRRGELDAAVAQLVRLSNIADDLPTDLRLKVLYDRACLASLRAQRETAVTGVNGLLNEALEHLQAWFSLGMAGGWAQAAASPENEVRKMGNDGDLRLVLERLNPRVRLMLGDLALALPQRLPSVQSGGGGGCVLRGTPVRTPQGLRPVESLAEGDEIISIDPSSHQIITTRIVQVYSSRGTNGVRLNGQVVTADQPLYLGSGATVSAGDLTRGMAVLSWTAAPTLVATLEDVHDHFEIYTMTTDHASHNYLAGGLLCGNKKPRPDDWR